MPTYIYEIVDTGETFEIQQNIRDASFEEYKHPHSGEIVKVRRLVTGGTGFVLKGDGWTPPGNSPSWDSKIPKAARPDDGPEYMNKGMGGKVRKGPAKADASSKDKLEKSAEFTKWVESGGLDDVPPSMEVEKK